MPIAPPTDGPPPSPATNPAAAAEAGQPMNPAGLAKPMQMNPQGPDLSGILTLAEKLDQGLLSLASAVPDGAAEIEQCRQCLARFGAKFLTTSGQNNGSMPAAAPKGQVVSQAGNQFPAGGQSAGKPY